MCDEKKTNVSGLSSQFFGVKLPNFQNQTLLQFRKREAANDDDKVVWVHEDLRGGIDAQGQAGKYLTRQFIRTLVREPTHNQTRNTWTNT